MDVEWIRALCLSLPGATEQILWEHDLVFKVGGKMFAAAPLEPAAICLSFKCSDEDFIELIERPGIIPSPLRRARPLGCARIRIRATPPGARAAPTPSPLTNRRETPEKTSSRNPRRKVPRKEAPQSQTLNRRSLVPLASLFTPSREGPASGDRELRHEQQSRAD